MVSVWREFACCVTDSGAVWVCGMNRFHRLGQHAGVREFHRVFRRLDATACGGASIAAVSCGFDFLIALTRTGEVWSCGAGDCGQLGHSNLEGTPILARVAALENIAMVVASMDTTAAVDTDGLVWVWGSQRVSCEVGGWAYLSTPQCMGLSAFGGHKAVLVAAGTLHRAVVTEHGGLWTWGFGGDGQLGHGDNEHQVAPMRVVSGLQDSRVWMVSCGMRHTLVATEDGFVFGMGSSAEGCIRADALGEFWVPTHIDKNFFGGARIVSVSAGESCSTAVSEQGCMYWWGRNVLGLEEPGTGARHSCARVAATCLPGGRVGRAKRLASDHILVVAMGAHNRLGAAHTMPGFASDEILHKIARSCTVPHDGYRALSEGMRRLVVAEPAGGGVF